MPVLYTHYTYTRVILITRVHVYYYNINADLACATSVLIIYSMSNSISTILTKMLSAFKVISIGSP